MATTVDHLAGGDSPLASRNPEMTARFVNEALPYLNQLNDRARRLARNAVDTEDLMQETMLRAHVGFHTYSGGTNVRAWLFRIMSDTYVNGLRRAQHRPCDYLTDHITDRQLAAQDRHSSQGPRSAELDALADKVLVETDMAKRDQMIKQAFEIGIKDYGYIPLHQQALAWGVSKKVKLTQRADNQVLLYWATKQE